MSQTKISDMDRDQLKEYMNSNGEIHRMNSDSRAWQRAFQLARQSGYGQLDMDCGKCWEKVKAFMQK